MSLNPFAPDVTDLVVDHAASALRYPDADARDRGARGMRWASPPIGSCSRTAARRRSPSSPPSSPCGRVDEPDFSLYRRHLRDGGRGRAALAVEPAQPDGPLAPRRRDRRRCGTRPSTRSPRARGPRGDTDAIVVGSLTKVFACPGLRVGYVLAPDAAVAAALGPGGRSGR